MTSIKPEAEAIPTPIFSAMPDSAMTLPHGRTQDFCSGGLTSPVVDSGGAEGARIEALRPLLIFNITNPIVTDADEVKTTSQKFAKPTATKQIRSN